MSEPKKFIAFAAVPALILAVVVLLALTPWARGVQSLEHAVTATVPVATAPAPPSQALPPGDLDRLRSDATIGDLEAGRILVTILLDRYERAGNTDDLYEAVQWMDREWNAGFYQLSGLATRVYERHCGNRVLRWHWLCDSGE